MIFHITTVDEWVAVERARGRRFEPAALAADGFVHCSTREQLSDVANARFAGRADLVVLCLDETMLAAPLRYENLEGGDELFPHVYGPLNLGAVVAAIRWEPGPDGAFEAPPLPPAHDP